METQLDLTPRPAEKDVAWLESALLVRPGWHYAADLCALASLPRTEDSKRAIRALANASDCIISGQRGYAHVKHVPLAEVMHASQWLISQGRQMIARAIRLRRRAHSLVG